MKNNSVYEDEKRNFNGLDIMIIIIAVLMVFVVIFRTQIISIFSDAATKTDCEIYFTCEAVPNELAPSITDGSPITWLDAEAELGRMTKTTALEPSKSYIESGNDLIIVRSDKTMRFSGMINSSAIKNNGCYIDGTQFLAAGMTITMTTGTVQFQALITDVVFIEN